MKYQPVSELDGCPHCGYDEYYVKQTVSGTIEYNMMFGGEDAHNEDMYDGLTYKSQKFAYCKNCNKKIARNDTV